METLHLRSLFVDSYSKDHLHLKTKYLTTHYSATQPPNTQPTYSNITYID